MKKLDLTKIKTKLDKVPKEFNGKVAQIGFPKGIAYEDGTSVAYVAAIQEYGAPSRSIPPRPFIQPTIKAEKDKWVKIIEKYIPQVVLGKTTAFDALDLVGRVAVADIQETIAHVYSPALSPITVLLRKWRKEGRTITGKTVGEAANAIKEGASIGSDNKPLNDTGYMQASVTNAVNKVGAPFNKG